MRAETDVDFDAVVVVDVFELHIGESVIDEGLEMK